MVDETVISISAAPPVVRRPGRPKGLGRVANSGRKPGTKNRRTIAVEEVMSPFVARAKRTLRRLLNDGDDETQLKVAALVLAYKFGRPTERREISGPGGAPQQHEKVDSPAERRAAAVRVLDLLGNGGALPPLLRPMAGRIAHAVVTDTASEEGEGDDGR